MILLFRLSVRVLVRVVGLFAVIHKIAKELTMGYN